MPWTLSNVFSGTPRIHEPYIEQAKYAAYMRTYYWQRLHAGDATSRNADIRHPEGINPYPPQGAHISDVPAADSGGNFGRLARINGLMTEWTTQLANSPVSGIPARYWVEFLRAFSESNDEDQLRRKIANVRKGDSSASPERADRVVELLTELKVALPQRPDSAATLHRHAAQKRSRPGSRLVYIGNITRLSSLEPVSGFDQLETGEMFLKPLSQSTIRLNCRKLINLTDFGSSQQPVPGSISASGR